MVEKEEEHINIELTNDHTKLVYKQVQESMDSKTEEFKKKVLINKEVYIKMIYENFTKFQNDINEINANDNILKTKTSNLSNDEKLELKKKISNIREKIERVTCNFKEIEKYNSYIGKKKINELLGFNEENFNDLSLEVLTLNDELEAHLVITDRCRLCKSKLLWKTNPYSMNLKNKCSFSQNCSGTYRMYCKDCDMNYCTQCALPSDPTICGCSKKMEHLYVSGHICDICGLSLYENVWRCTNCDCDICDKCFKECSENCGIIDTSKKVEKIEDIYGE